jgi:hypothetical protein
MSIIACPFALFFAFVLFDGSFDFAQNFFTAFADRASERGYDIRRVEVEHA